MSIKIIDKPDSGLANSEKMQQALLGYMLTDFGFAQKCKTFLEPNLFISTNLSEMFAATCAFMEQYKTVPSPDALCDYLADKPHFKLSRPYAHDCVGLTAKYRYEFVRDSISDWIRISLFKKSINSGIKCIQTGDLDGITREMRMFFDQATKAQFGATGTYDFSDPLKDFKELTKLYQSDITTGIKEFDELLGGGFLRSTHTVLLSPLNVGKTTAALNFAVHNLFRGKDVLLLTHEDLDLNIATKIRYRMLKMTRSEVHDAIVKEDKGFEKALMGVNKILEDHLVYIGRTRSFYVEDVVNEIRVQAEQLYTKKQKYFDLVIDDYPGKLSSHKMTNLKDIRHGVKYCYNEFERLAQEYKWHQISPVQTNREGYNRNKYREVADEMLDAGDISESLGVAQDASNIISLNRSDKDAAMNRMYFKIVKTRGAPANSVIQTNTCFKIGLTHDQAIGHTIIKGSNDFLQNKNIGDILMNEVITAEGASANPDVEAI